MSVSLLLTVAALLTGAAPFPATSADTTLTVTRGERLVLENFSGRLSVGVGEEDAVRIPGRADGGDRFEVVRGGEGLTVRARDPRNRRRAGPIRVSVPPWLDVEIRGPRTEVEARGLRAGLRVRSVHGSVRVRDVSGPIEVQTVHGEVIAEEVSGRIRLQSVEEDVRIRGGSGVLEVNTVDGDVILEAIEAERVSATSVDGDVRLEGRLPAGARYRLSTHDGDVRVALADSVDADVVVSTFDGEFEADFPVTLDHFRGGQEMRFTLGEGGSELVLEAFDGDIELRRGGG